MSLPDLRLQHILAELARDGRVFVKDLADHLEVSRETIRRDLKQLELSGHLRCTYGGGVKPLPKGDQPVSDRMRVNAREKAKVAAIAARLVGDDHRIFIDAGTTTLAFARHLMRLPQLTVFTNSLDIAHLLGDGDLEEVVVVGGSLKAGYRALLGQMTVDAIGQHLFDSAFISIGTVDYTHGFMDFAPEEAWIRRKLIAHSRRVVMMADSKKFGRQAAIRSLELNQIDVLVTDAPPRADFAARLEAAGVEVIHA
ncbi:DeoR/GlpR family DNA-binding transcription regulator [Methylobrevis albus]|uniref:DeoR/GlpR transcriptional regulator n=1 Tax=Methylobrevis albus TaxID=2793297 RepID=A0A931MX67_9HYPH|nr:DeoR/GlpR family DNA-binding transcription regulator [Methylobrevis albus]MBH0236365.1 DeoR/GlpR transcriptional regulator [Methylobrevis albus]